MFLGLHCLELVVLQKFKDVDHESSVLYPKLYWPGIHNSLFNAKTFMICVLESVLTSLALFFISYGAFKDAIRSNGRDVADLQSVGYVVASYLVVVVTLRCGLETSYWTFFNHFAIWGSIVFYFCMMFVIYSDLFVYEYYGVTTQALGSGLFWFTLGVMLASVTITVFLVKAIISTVHPSLASMIRINKKMALVTTRRPKVRHASKTKSKLQEHHRLHRPHLGYAFSHEEGIGKLITTGSMMKVRQGESGQKGASLGDQSLPTESKLNQMEEVQDKVKKRPEIWSSVPNLPSESVESVQHVYEHEKVQEL